MYHTWFFQKRLAAALHDKLSGLKVLTCFSQQKDELVISFGDAAREFHVRADMSSRAGILSFKDYFARARKNSVDLFKEIMDKEVQLVTAYKHERSFYIQLENQWQLIFKMHGNRSNLLLAHNNQVKKIFRNNLPSDLQIIPSELNNSMDLTEPNILRLLGPKNHYLVNNQELTVSQFNNKFNSQSIFIGVNGVNPILSLVEIENPLVITEDPLTASNEYAGLFYHHFNVENEKNQIEKIWRKQLKQSVGYIKKTSEKLKEVKQQRNPEEIANIIMANLLTLNTGQSQVTLHDLYNNKPIEIKLNPKFSPQKNAEVFYRKSKNKKIEVEKLEENISAKQKSMKRLQHLIQLLNEITNLQDLKEFKKEHFQRKSQQNDAPLPYHTFEVDGYQVLVGKNAKSNDLLTQKVAKKNDLWLHARDVPGSHVVIRENPGHIFPKPVIEQVAALAAWYSKRKTDSLCPVIYTQKKFVRKIKGAPAGQVVVEKEQIVMVKPTNPMK